MTKSKEYLRFEEYVDPSRKTPLCDVISLRSNVVLGTIKWYAPWRQFCFYPAPETIFNPSCMAQITKQIEQMRKDQVALVRERYI